MAERHARHSIHLEYCFDRLLDAKLEQVYAILVPDRTRRLSGSDSLRGDHHEDCGDLRTSVIGSAEGE